jgi:recombination protein U
MKTMENTQENTILSRNEQGKLNRQRGAEFERLIEISLDELRKRGKAYITKNCEPYKILRSIGKGRFITVHQANNQPDYKGLLNKGKSVIMEAKYTAGNSIPQTRLTPNQTEIINEYEAFGAKCYLILGFGDGKIYRIPWQLWRDMKTLFGRKHIKQSDINRYKVSYDADNDYYKLF